MAAEDPSKLNLNEPEVRLSRFLFVGKEYLDYQPGNWFLHNYFQAMNVPSIMDMSEDVDKQLVPIEIITKAFESNLVPNPETLVFALAVCCRQKKSESLRRAAYTNLKKICASPQHFILFVKFALQLNKQKELDVNGLSKHGWGCGFKKAVNNWYFSKEPLELAKCVTRYRGRYGWKHKDIIKLSHLHPDTAEREVIFKYIMHGLEKTKRLFEGNSKVAELIEYIEKVEDFKHCEDDLKAASLLQTHKFTLDHVPGHLLKSSEIWNSLIPSMNLNLLLHNLQRIHNLGLLKPDAPAVGKIIDELINEEKLSRDNVHPALVLITIKNYENSGKPLSYEKRKVKEEARKPLPPPPKPNVKIIEALYKALNLSFNHLQPTGLRYIVTIDMNKTLENRTWRSGNVNGAEAGCMIALSLLRCEKNVMVATFKNIGIHTASLDKQSSFSQAMRRLRQMPIGVVNLSKPMEWASYQNNKYDVFINVVEHVNDKSDSFAEAIAAYRTNLKLPHAKLINCAVCSSTTHRQNYSDENILTINGFDATVPSIIQAFAKSLF